MRRSANICLALSLLTCAACSPKSARIASAPPVYQGIPAGLIERCKISDLPLETTGDLVIAARTWRSELQACAARVDAIRAHDAEARGSAAR